MGDDATALVVGDFSGLDPDILALARSAPRAALARLRGALDAPLEGTIYASFPTTSSTIASGDLDIPILGQDWFIYDVAFDIQNPSAFPGSNLKTLYDYLYNKTSGIQARCSITGNPRYDVAPNYVPLSNLFDFIPKRWPRGWRLTRYNSIHMDFQPGSPLPFAPVDIAVTFRGFQYVCNGIDNMSVDAVFCALKEAGYDLPAYLRTCGNVY